MADSPVIARVTTLVTPILADLGLDLYDLDFGAGLLKITVDKPGGANLDEIALATRLINREFDHVDPVPGKYTLETTRAGSGPLAALANLRLFGRHGIQGIGVQHQSGRSVQHVGKGGTNFHTPSAATNHRLVAKE